jgi:hypothetical protein
MFAFVRNHRSCVNDRQEALQQERSDVEQELNDVQNFLITAPALREEALLLVPPPDDLLVDLPESPNRSDLARMQRLSYLNGVKLFAMLVIFIGAALWFVNRFLHLGH